jgi:hypothetical protein
MPNPDPERYDLGVSNSVPRMTPEKLLNGLETLDLDAQIALREYFSMFAEPNEEGKCLKCGKVQGGMMAALLGGFEYGLQHGEGRCGSCGWPGRACHYPKTEDGKEIFSLQDFILQYHPSVVEGGSNA